MCEEMIKDWIGSNVIGHYGCGCFCGRGNDSGNGYAGDKCGSNYGNGSWISGYVSGAGYNNGSGDGSGYGVGNDNGSDNSYGIGNGCGKVTLKRTISKFDGYEVYKINKTNTIITSIIGNFAKGFILNRDLTLKKCYIAKQDGEFTQGRTLEDALFLLNIRLNNLEEYQEENI